MIGSSNARGTSRFVIGPILNLSPAPAKPPPARRSPSCCAAALRRGLRWSENMMVPWFVENTIDPCPSAFADATLRRHLYRGGPGGRDRGWRGELDRGKGNRSRERARRRSPDR